MARNGRRKSAPKYEALIIEAALDASHNLPVEDSTARRPSPPDCAGAEQRIAVGDKCPLAALEKARPLPRRCPHLIVARYSLESQARA